MARKQALKPLTKAQEREIAAMLKSQPDLEGAELQAWESFVEASAEYERAWNSEDDKEIERRMRIMFQKFDGFNALIKHTITVSKDDIRQVVYDVLMSSHDALDSDFMKMTPLERGRALKGYANWIVMGLEDARIKVHEESMESPMCGDCQAELAA